MSLPLATLEGLNMTPNRRTAQRLNIRNAHALYGLDSDDMDTLGGWWTDLKRGTSRVTSSVIGAAKSSGIPVVSTIASSVRAGGQIAEESGLIPNVLRTGGGATSPTMTVADSATTTDKTWKYLGIGAIGLLAFVALGKSR